MQENNDQWNNAIDTCPSCGSDNLTAKKGSKIRCLKCNDSWYPGKESAYKKALGRKPTSLPGKIVGLALLCGISIWITVSVFSGGRTKTTEKKNCTLKEWYNFTEEQKQDVVANMANYNGDPTKNSYLLYLVRAIDSTYATGMVSDNCDIKTVANYAHVKRYGN